ncbi:MAG: hypothetical protein HC922_02380 [Leptolyngbyaceae cyanobacterium SM2_3_12]|nr:hypothetical protein [Leptolyngbyaceae cyanobacterium SM2_3_12]
MSPWDSLDSWSNYSSRPPATLEDILYEHLQYWRRQEPTHQMIERFRRLFLDAANYPDSSVTSALLALAEQSTADREFKYVLNRCCYTLINLWYTQPRDHWAIPELVGVLETAGEANSTNPHSRKIQALVQEFVSSDQYAALGRLQRIFSEPNEFKMPLTMAVDEQPLAYRIRYYPFLYDNSLLTKDSGQEQKKNITDLRRKAETDLGIRLARYHTHQKLGASEETKSSLLINPTLLESAGLDEALGYYTGKFDGSRTHRDLARWFSTYSKTARSFRDFKDEFVDYLINPIAAMEPKYNGKPLYSKSSPVCAGNPGRI